MLNAKPALCSFSPGIISMASEIEQLYTTPRPELINRSTAAVRGRRRVSGQGKGSGSLRKGRSYPGESHSVGKGDSLANGLAAAEVFKADCLCGSDLKAYKSLCSTAHAPADDYDFARPWHCMHWKRDIFKSKKREFFAAAAELKSPKENADGDDEAAEKLQQNFMIEHAMGCIWKSPLRVSCSSSRHGQIHRQHAPLRPTQCREVRLEVYCFAYKVDEHGRE
eukprot:6206828-Pleurochrysis_carterae.AAC.6